MVMNVLTGMVQGVEGILIRVEADVGRGLPVFNLFGSLSYEVKEARDRVRTAMKNSGYPLPASRIMVNLAPADIRKNGTGFDLAIAVALLLSMGILSPENTDGILFLGELSLDGTVAPVGGVLPIIKEALKEGFRYCVVSEENQEEASLLPEMKAMGVRTLLETIGFLKRDNSDGRAWENVQRGDDVDRRRCKVFGEITDFSEIAGQQLAKRALEIAVAGFHNLLLDGPPGVGKSMLASSVPGIMPEMTMEEKIETTMIYSVKGLLENGFSLVERRPYRAPSHSITMTGMFGGGLIPKPGEISLAHRGVLFLDELPEYKKEMLEMFRVPLEKHEITQIRNQRRLTFPADFILIAAANPCPCGYHPDRRRCHCSLKDIRKYQNRLSGPMRDRMDLFVRCEEISYDTLTGTEQKEDSETVRKRVAAAWERQKGRTEGYKYHFNGRMTAKEIGQYCQITEEGGRMLRAAFETFHMSGRSYYSILKTARTIADLEGNASIHSDHLEEALLYRHASEPD